RRLTLAHAWMVPVAGGTGLAVPLYRRMLNEAVLAETLEGLAETDRMIFRRLASSPRLTTKRDLLRSLPFAEDRVTASLAVLEGLGLVWPGQAPGREREESAWFVPSDLVRTLRSVRRPTTTAPGNTQVYLSPPALRILDRPIVANVPSNVVVDLISSLSDRADARNQTAPRTDPVIRAFARRIGIGLGVWEEDTRAVCPGPRYARWQEASEVERRRAVARLWLVEGGARRVDGPLRRAAWDTMRDAEPERWYDFNSVARVLASRLGPLEAGGNGPPSASQSDSNRALSRSNVERVLLDLAWLGVLNAGTNPVGRLVAIQVTPIGKRAIDDQ
ncbi:MAG TPA: hypothetical protein VMW65_06865, partial [Chloroflexota bacterium]|nr:hypothetical protein [Chloroflexota bacterium]